MIKKFKLFENRFNYTKGYPIRDNRPIDGISHPSPEFSIKSSDVDIDKSKFEADKRELYKSFKELVKKYDEFNDKYKLSDMDKKHAEDSISTIFHMGNSVKNFKL